MSIIQLSNDQSFDKISTGNYALGNVVSFDRDIYISHIIWKKYNYMFSASKPIIYEKSTGILIETGDIVSKPTDGKYQYLPLRNIVKLYKNKEYIIGANFYNGSNVSYSKITKAIQITQNDVTATIPYRVYGSVDTIPNIVVDTQVLDIGVVLTSYKSFIIKQNNQYYSIKPKYYQNGKFTPLQITKPTVQDYENFGFDDLNLLVQNMEIGEEIFKPIDKIGDRIEILKCVDK